MVLMRHKCLLDPSPPASEACAVHSETAPELLVQYLEVFSKGSSPGCEKSFLKRGITYK